MPVSLSLNLRDVITVCDVEVAVLSQHHKHDTRRTKRATNDGHVFFGWMKGASRRGPSQNRQYKAGRRRGRILLPGPPPASERRPIRSRMSKPAPQQGR